MQSTEETTVADSSGAVTLVLEDDGGRVNRVQLAADWQDRIDAGQLGSTVMDLLGGVRLVRASSGLGDVPVGISELSTPTAIPDPWPLVERLTVQMPVLLDTMDALLDDLLAAEARPEPIVGRSENRKVEVAYDGGELNSVHVDEPWAAKASRQKCSDSLLEAFEDAYRQGGMQASSLSQSLDSLESILREVGLAGEERKAEQW